MEARRRHFIAHGAVSADHSHEDVRTDPLEPAEADRIYRAALAGEATDAEAVALRRHMLLEMARMSCEDGLVMTLHPGVRRGHHGPTTAAFGADTGDDIPIRVEFTDALRPLLERYGTHPNLHLVVFTLDETVLSRELAPLAGFYPSLYVGAPWWFLDAPEAIRRFRAAVTETAGFSRTSGFIDDTRAFCSIPARHDMSRRLDAGWLAQLVAEHRLDEDEAAETALDLVTGRPRRCSSCDQIQATAGTLSRVAGHGRPAAPVRLVHLGLGNFFRAHQAWYTDRAPDAGDGASPPSPAAAPSWPTRSPPRTASTRWSRGPPTATASTCMSSIARAHAGARPRGLAGAAWPRRTCAR